VRKILSFVPRRAAAERVVATGTVVTLALAAVACGSDDAGDTGSGGSGAVDVVVTTSILGDIVSAALGDLAGSEVNVEVLMPIGADPHDFEPSARQAETMEDADLLVVNGLGLEEGLSGVVDAVADAGTPVFTFTDHIELIDLAAEDHADEDHADEEDPADEDHADDEEDHADEEDPADEDHADEGPGHVHDGDDPHFWTDPVRVAAAVAALGDELAELGVDTAVLDEAVADSVADLEALAEEIGDVLAVVPDDRRALVTNHDSFGYFAERFDFDVIGAVIPSLTTSAESSARALEELAAIVAERGLPAVFAETTESDRLARALADEVGGDVTVVELYSGSLGEPGSGAETYRGYMITNAERIAAALG
jgi:zinc/manganese transport system substrate-binding protein